MEQTETAPSLSHSQFIRIAFEALALRAARWAALLIAAALFGVSAWLPDWHRIVTASAFTVLVYLPLLFRKEKP